MYLWCQGSQLPGSQSYRGRPLTGFFAPGSHPGNPSSQDYHGSPLFPGPCRLLPAVCEGFCCHSRPFTCFDQERRGLSLEYQAAFDQLKHLLMTSPITAFPDFSQAFRLYTDASTAGLGAILAQVRDGEEHIICCASRALNQAEKAYPATKLECLAIVWAVPNSDRIWWRCVWSIHRPLRTPVA